jgi:hypothetical protein
MWKNKKIENTKLFNFQFKLTSLILQLETKNIYTKNQFIEQTNKLCDTLLLYVEK